LGKLGKTWDYSGLALIGFFGPGTILPNLSLQINRGNIPLDSNPGDRENLGAKHFFRMGFSSENSPNGLGHFPSKRRETGLPLFPTHIILERGFKKNFPTFPKNFGRQTFLGHGPKRVNFSGKTPGNFLDRLLSIRGFLPKDLFGEIFPQQGQFLKPSFPHKRTIPSGNSS